MKRRIELESKKIEYTLKKSTRAKRLRMAVYCDGSFVVTAPHGLVLERIESYIRQKAEWILEKMNLMAERKETHVFTRRSKKEYLQLKGEALAFAQGKVEYFNKLYKFQYHKISIKNQKTRWGSCSKKGNLNYNYKVVLLPERYAEYIIVHELCHLKEFNHSVKFWRLVEKAIPDYRERIEEMRKM